ncbi:uncharacterized protein RAG0_16752 [Rhynchosporium agropyri]|uniref:Uncharacterized protein n=1 Tax=Rhynchosporium agropyri TaxID=914238 RepID=A0A1E1LRQ3_9HELO|nr:uncharacterized protein RAG0_16752 [Rhynchosporium agropyri]
MILLVKLARLSIVNIVAQSTSRESSSAIALTLLLLLEEFEEVYSNNSSSIKESLESLSPHISRTVINTRIAVKVDDSEIIASRGIEFSALAPEAIT